MKSNLSVTRVARATLNKVEWTDDLFLEWPGPRGPCAIRLVLDYQFADARLIVKHGTYEEIVAGGLGALTAHHVRVHLDEGDEIALQWRAWSPSEEAISEVADLAVEALDDQFAE